MVVKNLEDVINGDQDDLMNELASVVSKVLPDSARETIMEEALDRTATQVMEMMVVRVSRAMKMLGEGDEDPLLNVIKVVSKLTELSLLNMLARIDDDTPKETLDTLVEYINSIVSVKMKNDASIVDLHRSVHAQVKAEQETHND